MLAILIPGSVFDSPAIFLTNRTLKITKSLRKPTGDGLMIVFYCNRCDERKMPLPFSATGFQNVTARNDPTSLLLRKQLVRIHKRKHFPLLNQLGLEF